MVVINIILTVCLLVLLAIVGYMVIGYFTRNRMGKITFIRSFKNGKCLIIYLLAIPIFCLGRIYQSVGLEPSFNDVITNFFKAITDAFTAVIMRFNVDGVSKLMANNEYYRFVAYFYFALVIMNTVLFWLSVASQRFWCFRRDVEGKLTKKNLLYILGYNEGSLNVYNSDTSNYKFIIGDITDAQAVTLYGKKIAYYVSTSYLDYLETAIKKAVKGKQKITVVINTEDDDVNVKLCRAVVEFLNGLPEEEKSKFFLKFKVYVFGSLTLKAVYEDIVSSAYGTVEFVNKYQKIAMDFIDKYPFSAFANENQIDPSTSLVKPNVNVNCIMVGFGKINRQILLTSVANNQFMTLGKNGLEEKLVNYYIFDKVKSQNDKNLNHSYYRYRNEFNFENESEYLPLPKFPSNEYYYNIDVESKEFYDKVGSVIKNKNDINFVIISLGDDLENVDMAQKFIEKRLEWGGENTVIFVRSKSWKKSDTLLEQEDCYFIGNENDVVYDINKITNDKIFEMALMRNKLYYYEKLKGANGGNLTDKEIEDINVKYLNKWFCKNTQLERESGLYCCLSLRFKLNLMGLDYTLNKNEGSALTEEEYYNIYANGDEVDFYVTDDGMRLISYNLNFKNSLRRNLAEQEHQRWNSFMLSNGVVPATIKQIESETITVDGIKKYTNGKNYALRRHGNITTFNGLIDFRKIISKRDGISEEQADVFKYDYQILDEAYKLLTELGYKIIKKQ